MARTERITLEKKPGDEWERIVGYALGDKPPRLEDPDNLPAPGPEHALAAYGYTDDEVPF